MISLISLKYALENDRLLPIFVFVLINQAVVYKKISKSILIGISLMSVETLNIRNPKIRRKSVSNVPQFLKRKYNIY